jgi:ribosomal protein S3AE
VAAAEMLEQVDVQALAEEQVRHRLQQSIAKLLQLLVVQEVAEEQVRAVIQHLIGLGL